VGLAHCEIYLKLTVSTSAVVYIWASVQ